MFTRFDTNKSTKGASKLRRDLINAEIANLRDLLPLPQSTRQRLSQLQLMALVCVYVRKANYFQQVFKRHEIALHQAPTPNIGFSKALSGFLMMLTQNGKLLYISDNAAEYLGHSMEDLLIHGDSVYDIIDKQDHGSIQAELGRNVPQQTSGSHHSTTSSSSISSLEGEHRMFLCRMNVSRNARRQMRFGDQKVVLVQGHYLSFLPLCSRNEPVFLATCTPIAMPETRECVVQGATNVFTTIHSMDMKIVHVDKNGEFHLGYTRNELQGISWYQILHWDSTREAQNKHRLITQSEQDRSCILLVQMQRSQGDFIWVHVVLQVRDSQDSNQQPVIVCTNQVLSDREASVMLANSWLYHYYSVQSKIQFGLPYDGSTTTATTTTSPRMVPPTTSYYPHHSHHSHHHSPTTALQTNLTHPYITSHIPTYGYHSPVGILPSHNQNSPGLITHQNGTVAATQPPQLNHHNSNMTASGGGNGGGGGGGGGGSEYYRSSSSSSSTLSYSYRIDTQPVDYSQTMLLPQNNQHYHQHHHHHHHQAIIEPRCSSANSINNDNRGGHSPPNKKRAIARLEPLYIPENVQELSDLSLLELHSQHSFNGNDVGGAGGGGAAGGINGTNNGGGGTVLLTAVIPTRHRLYTKALPLQLPSDTSDLIDQWNPSPPWSETAQKVPDIIQQELSPYLTTTPPTPNSAAQPTHGPAFSFDWMSEQFVPVMDCSPCVPCLTQDGLSISMPVTTMPLPMSHWPPDHRILSIQSTPPDRISNDENSLDVREQRRSH